MSGLRILLIGYGNAGRGDDGLGPALAARIESLGLTGVTVDCDYQLTVDHAAAIAQHDIVVFADAAMGLIEPYRFSRITAGEQHGLGSHQVSPETALALAKLLFNHEPEAWLLGIGGKEFHEVREGLGARAHANLKAATSFLERWLVTKVPHPVR